MKLQISVELPDIEGIYIPVISAIPAQLYLALQDHVHPDDITVAVAVDGYAAEVVASATAIGRLEGVLKAFTAGQRHDHENALFEITFPGEDPF